MNQPFRWHVFRRAGTWFTYYVPMTGPIKRVYEGTSFVEAHSVIDYLRNLEPS